MMDAETIRFVKEEIKRQLNIILNSASGANTSQTETIDSLYPGMPGIDDRPVMHPFGFVSRATQGTISVTARVGADIQNRMTLGHRDKMRPDVEEGEVMLYNSTDDKIYVSHGKIISTTPHWVEKSDLIHIGSEDAKEPFVLGLIFQAFEDKFLQLMRDHRHVTSAPGALTSIPDNTLDIEEIRQSPILDNKILSDKIFGEKP